MPTIDLGFLIGQSPEQAVEHLRAKGYVLSFNWREVWGEAHAKAFTVAGVLKADVLADIRTSLDRSLDEGKTFNQFRDELEPSLQQKGWWGRGAIVDQGSGEITGKRLDARRLKTIYETNMASAYNAGRYTAQRANVEARPYWEYVAVMDSHTRPAHKALNGRIYRYDDPFWARFYPPNGYNCRCRVRARSQRDIEHYDLPVASSEGRMTEVDQVIDREGQTRPAPGYRDPLTQTVFTADPGFAYNPGQAALANAGQLLLDRVAVAPPRQAALALQEAMAQPPIQQAVSLDVAELAERVTVSQKPQGETRHVGALPLPVLDALDKRKLSPVSGVLSLRDTDILQAVQGKSPLPATFWVTLPTRLSAPHAILLDKTQTKPVLLYVFDGAKDGERMTVAIDVSMQTGRTPRPVLTQQAGNRVRPGGPSATVDTLQDRTQYDLLWGKV